MNKRYKTELHSHTRTVSPCAGCDPTRMAEKYAEHGYRTVVVTDHLKSAILNEPAKTAFLPNRPHFLPSDFDLSIFERSGTDRLTWEDKVNFFTAGARYLQEVAGDRFTVLQSAEICLPANRNDYLLFGADRDFLMAYPDLDRCTLPELRRITKEADVLLVQAHPFRNNITITDPSLLDGVEIYNGHPDHDGRNFLAKQWAAHYGLSATSGTDFHDEDHTPDAGILTEEPILSLEQLKNVLRSGAFDLIREMVPRYPV